MNILWVCHYFTPEIGAPSARLHEMSRMWIALGHRVSVITCFPNHPTGVVPPEYRGRLASREVLDGIEVLRNWVYATPNEGVFKKTLGHVSFMLSSILLGLPRLGKVDVVIASSPTFLSVFSAYFISLVRNIPFIFEVRDLWPAVFVDLGVITNRPVIDFLEFWEMFLYRRAARVVTVTESFREILLRRGLPPEKVVTITNGSDVDFFSPGVRENGVRSDLGLNGKFVITYIGAHGISHGLDVVLRAAAELRDKSEFAFLFVGEGAEKSRLIALRDVLGLSNVTFLPGQPRMRVLAIYRASDVMLVPLRNVALFESFIPSKMFEIMACARPIVGLVRGEPRAILSASEAAVLVEPGDVDGLAEALCWLYAHPGERSRMGAAGRAFVTEHYDRRRLAEAYAAILESVVQSR